MWGGEGGRGLRCSQLIGQLSLSRSAILRFLVLCIFACTFFTCSEINISLAPALNNVRLSEKQSLNTADGTLKRQFQRNALTPSSRQQIQPFCFTAQFRNAPFGFVRSTTYKCKYPLSWTNSIVFSGSHFLCRCRWRMRANCQGPEASTSKSERCAVLQFYRCLVGKLFQRDYLIVNPRPYIAYPRQLIISSVGH